MKSHLDIVYHDYAGFSPVSCGRCALTKQSKIYQFLSLVLLLLGVGFPLAMHADSGIWAGGQTGDWRVDGNWSGTTFPDGVDQVAEFDATSGNGTDPIVVTLTDDITLSRIDNGTTSLTGSSSTTVYGQDITIQGDGTTRTLRFNDAAKLNNHIIFSGAGAGNLTLASDVDVALDAGWQTGGVEYLSFNNSAMVTINGVVKDGLVTTSLRNINANGLLVLNGANTYTGETRFERGKIQLGHNSALGTSTITGELASSGSAEFRVASGSNIAIANAMTYSNGTNALILKGSNSSSLEFSSNTMSLSGTDMQLTATSGTHAVKFSGTGFTSTAGVTLGANTTLELAPASGTQTWSGIISGSGALVKNGAGTLALSGNSTFSGGTTITQGIVDVTHSNALGTGDVLIETNNGTMLRLAGNVTLANNIETGNYAAWAAHIRSISGTNEITGTVTLSSYGGSNVGENTIIVNSGSTLTLNNIQTSTFGNDTKRLQIRNSGTLNINGVYSEADATNYGRLQITDGDGTTTFNAATSITGPVSIARGTVIASADDIFVNSSGVNLGDGSANSAVAINLLTSGAYTISNDLTINSNNVGGTTTIGGNSAHNSVFSGNIGLNRDLTLTAATNGEVTFSGIISDSSGSNAVTKTGDGTVLLSNANTYTGTTTVNAGVLLINNANALGGTGSGTVVADGGQLALQGGITVTGESLELDGAGGGSGALNNLSGDNTWTGTVTLSTTNTRIGSDSGTLTLTGGIYSTNDNVRFTGAGNILVSNDGLHLGSGALFVLSGNTTITTASTFTGNTNVNGGVLNIQHAQALGTNDGYARVTNNRSLELQGGIAVGAKALQLLGRGGSNVGALRSISGANSWAGDVLLENADVEIASDADTLTLSGTITSHADNNNFYLSGAGDIVISGSITGDTVLQKTGAGTVYLSGNNTYSGGTNLTSSILHAQHASALGTGTATVDTGTTLRIDNRSETAWTVGNDFSLAGTLEGYSGGVTAAGGTMTFTGDTTLTGNATIINSSDSGSMTFDAGTTVNLSSHQLTLRAVNTGGRGLNMNSVVSGTGSVWVNSDNNVVFDGNGGANTYTGSTTVEKGTLRLNRTDSGGSSADAIVGDLVIGVGSNPWAKMAKIRHVRSDQIANTTAVTIGNDGFLELHTFSDTIGSLAGTGYVAVNGGTLTVGDNNSSTTYAGIIEGTSTSNFVKSGTGVLTLSGNNTFAGNYTVNDGTLAVSGELYNGVAGGSLLVNTGGTFRIDNQNVFSNATSEADLVLDGGTFQLENSFSGTLNLGSLTLSANSVIDFGGGSGIIRFADSISGLMDGSNNGLYFLDIWNYSGSFSGGGTDQLFFDGYALHINELAQIRFWSDDGNNLFGTPAIQLGSNEVVPVPEASTYLGGGLFTLLILGHFLRKFKRTRAKVHEPR